MIAWLVYIIVALILAFIFYLAILGINRGVEAKSRNKKQISENKFKKRKSLSVELSDLKKLYDNGALSKKEYDNAKKKILS